MMVGDRRPAVSLVFTSAPPPKKKERDLCLMSLGLCCGLTVPLLSVLCCGVKPLPWTQKGGAPSLDRPVFFSGCADVPDSLCECVPPHFPCVTVSFCYPFDLCLPDFHYKNVSVLCNWLKLARGKKCNVRELGVL